MNVIHLVRLGADPLFRQSMLDEPEKKNWLKKLMLVHGLEPWVLHNMLTFISIVGDCS